MRKEDTGIASERSELGVYVVKERPVIIRGRLKEVNIEHIVTLRGDLDQNEGAVSFAVLLGIGWHNAQSRGVKNVVVKAIAYRNVGRKSTKVKKNVYRTVSSDSAKQEGTVIISVK